MTTEEKAKRYDNLLVKLQKSKEDNDVCDERYCCVIDGIVPELKENEDEKVRNEIIAFVEQAIHRGGGTPIPKEQEAKWIAWLEKQGEQKPTIIIPKFKVGDVIRHKEQGFTCKIIAIDTEYRLSECSGTHLPFDSQDAYELVEQKSAWSEEDEKIMSTIMKEGDLKPSERNWLKSIKDRLGCEANCTTTKEWSEEDENIKQWIISDIEKLLTLYKKSSSVADKEIKWLESLQKRYTWNPSEEQINALDSTLQHSQVSYNSFKHLNSLFNDLKKLREG